MRSRSVTKPLARVHNTKCLILIKVNAAGSELTTVLCINKVDFFLIDALAEFSKPVEFIIRKCSDTLHIPSVKLSKCCVLILLIVALHAVKHHIVN